MKNETAQTTVLEHTEFLELETQKANYEISNCGKQMRDLEIKLSQYQITYKDVQTKKTNVSKLLRKLRNETLQTRQTDLLEHTALLELEYAKADFEVSQYDQIIREVKMALVQQQATQKQAQIQEKALLKKLLKIKNQTV